MDDRFEATFTLEVPAERVWKSLESASDAAGGDLWWLPGFEAPGEVIEADPERLLRLRKAAEPCKGTEIVVELESVVGGTRITIVQSGFGALFEVALDELSVGWSQIVADFALFLERGVSAKRYLRPWGSAGLGVRNTPAGAEVKFVQQGGFADRAGMQVGDLLLTIHNAPVFDARDLLTLLRAFSAGDEVETTWLRGAEELSATGVL